MKMFQNIEAGRTKNELAVAPRKLLLLATIEGARSIGLDSQIGSLTPGKRADVILVNTRALNLAVLADDPAHMLVEAAQPANIDTVIVDEVHSVFGALDERPGAAPAELHLYPAGHAFLNDENLIGTYNPEAAAQAWSRAVAFLTEHVR